MSNHDVSRALSRVLKLSQRLRNVALPVIGAFLLVASVQAQTPNTPVISDLARKNLARVGAPASQIEPVLRGNPGLLLELKSWLAREAADQGRILTDADLADGAVFDELRSDAHLRAIATRLLQRYGYLLPELNPDSLAGKQQDYIMKERTKRQLAEEAQPVVPASPNTLLNTAKNLNPCDPAEDPLCEPIPDSAGPADGTERDETPTGIPAIPRIPPAIPHSDSPKPNLQTVSSPASPLLDAQSSGLDSFLQMAGSGQMTSGTSGNGLDGALALAAMGNPLSLLGESANSVPQHENAQPVAVNLNTARSQSNRLPSTYQKAPVQTVHVRNPYESIPALYDMYAQAPERGAELKPFGADVFKRGTAASVRVPMDLPAGPDYVIGPGDTLAINVWGGVSRRFFREVDREGRLTLPDVGPVMIAGKRLDEAQRAVQTALRNEFRDISADVSLSRLRTVRVYVVGEVARPGAYDVSALSTALNALLVAGGPTSNGSLRLVQHYRGERLLEEVDVYDLILKGVRSGSYPLENGDSIRVPSIGPQVTVSGAVRRPAIYETHGETNLGEVLDLAGGILPTAALQHIEVQRLIAHETRTMLSLNFGGDDAQALSEKLASFHIEPGDAIHIFPIAPFNRDAVYLQGHVLRPGRYSYHKDLRLSDLVSSYSDLLPEPALRYAEIIRLNPPAYAPTVFSFNLGEALARPAASPVLQPLDTVRIFGRYDFEDAPTVTVTGAVRHPGTYRTPGEVHVSDAIHLAGNLARTAVAEDAQVVHHLPNGSVQVVSVNLREAEAGDPSENLLLASGDRLLVHEDETKANPEIVIIQGEVENPGRYALTPNLKVADLIRMAGGLKRSADPADADLTHFSVANSGNQKQEEVNIGAALAHQGSNDKLLENGDVLTIRRQTGWDDLGATVIVAGEMRHAGTYGIEPGERLSSVLKRAGGFTSSAYPYGAVLIRADVREQQEQSRGELIRRLQNQVQQIRLLPDTDADQKRSKDAAIDQLKATVSGLANNAPLGRVIINISSRIDHWANTAADIQLRAGDKLYVPKRLEYVSVSGQVYNPTAVAFRPGKSAEWYLQQAGGPTNLANKKGMFIIRADGSVFAGRGNSFWPGGLTSSLRPGDTVVVPEKAYVGGRNLQNVLLLAQVASAIASTAYLASLGL